MLLRVCVEKPTVYPARDAISDRRVFSGARNGIGRMENKAIAMTVDSGWIVFCPKPPDPLDTLPFLSFLNTLLLKSGKSMDLANAVTFMQGTF
jgi:hypothetical protein